MKEFPLRKTNGSTLGNTKLTKVLAILIFTASLSINGCSAEQAKMPPQEAPPTASAQPVLTDTRWKLVEFRSMDDAIGVQKPDPDPERELTMHLQANGEVSMKLDCNSGMSSWKATPGSDANSGKIEFTAVPMTKMLCPQPSMDSKVASDMPSIRSYRIENDQLFLSMMADAGIYVWQRMP